MMHAFSRNKQWFVLEGKKVSAGFVGVHSLEKYVFVKWSWWFYTVKLFLLCMIMIMIVLLKCTQQSNSVWRSRLDSQDFRHFLFSQISNVLNSQTKWDFLEMWLDSLDLLCMIIMCIYFVVSVYYWWTNVRVDYYYNRHNNPSCLELRTQKNKCFTQIFSLKFYTLHTQVMQSACSQY